jgi:L,D-transpeptidase catalytic domain
MPPGFSLLYFLAGFTLRPYVPPTLPPDPEPAPATRAVVEVSPREGGWDASVFARPSSTAPLAGHIAKGTRVAVRGELQVPSRYACESGVYLAVSPFGWLCSSDTRPTDGAPSTSPVLNLVDDTPVPYRYAMVNVAEGSFVPMWGSVSDLWSHLEPERQLGRGDSIAIEQVIENFEGARYYVTVDGKVVPSEGLSSLKNFSAWQGVALDASTHFPFGWVTPQKAPLYDAPDGKKKVGELVRRTRVDVLEEAGEAKKRWLRVGEGQWLRADHVNEVRVTARPEGTGSHPQWVDVDLGEQVVVAYANDQPVYATLTSSGREPNHTPRGNYPVWGKASAITMKSQEYDDAPYYVNRVPWVMFFQAHNALHGAYWHDRFGVVKSHGCANLAPLDARHLFEWLEPKLPAGWTSVRYVDLTAAPVVHVRDSKKLTKPFYQERNIGPPDKNDEAERLQKAMARREAEAAAEAAAAQASGSAPPAMPAPGVPSAPP